MMKLEFQITNNKIYNKPNKKMPKKSLGLKFFLLQNSTILFIKLGMLC